MCINSNLPNFYFVSPSLYDEYCAWISTTWKVTCVANTKLCIQQNAWCHFCKLCMWETALWEGGNCIIQRLVGSLSDDGRVVLTVNVHVTLVCWKLRSRNWIVGGAQFQLWFGHWLLWMVFSHACLDKCLVDTFSYSIASSFDILSDFLFSCYLAIQCYVDWGVHIVSKLSHI
jgi:hypothetical protein